MTPAEAEVGARVRSNIEFSGVPCGTDGMIFADYGTGVMVVWDLPWDPFTLDAEGLALITEIWRGVELPVLPEHIRGLRDGFDKARDLKYLDLVAGPPSPLHGEACACELCTPH